jgi:endo-1,4-beta-mannosidase
MPAQPFQLGVNYWPRRKAMYWWSDFDAAEVREEFDQIRDLGLKWVRIFLLWEDFQPAPDRISAEALGNLGQVCDAARDRGLKLNVTFFTGHMSGPSWTPRWMLRGELPVAPWVRQVVSAGETAQGGYLNPFEDPVVIAAEELQLRAVVSRFKDHPAVGLWNLGNEPDLFARPGSSEAGRLWTRRMTGLVHEIDSAHPVTCGLHMMNLVQDNGLRVDQVFSETDLAVMHGYPMYADWSAGPLDPDFVPFLCALTSALCGKPTLMEEFGGCTAQPGQPASALEWTSYGQPRRQYMASEEGMAAYVEQVLPKLVEVGARGAMLWCYADYVPELYTRPPCEESWHERFFGLVRPDGSLKPHAEVIRRFAATGPTVQAARRQVTLTVTPEEYYQDPARQAKQAYRSYRDKYAFTGDEEPE